MRHAQLIAYRYQLNGVRARVGDHQRTMVRCTFTCVSSVHRFAMLKLTQTCAAFAKRGSSFKQLLVFHACRWNRTTGGEFEKSKTLRLRRLNWPTITRYARVPHHMPVRVQFVCKAGWLAVLYVPWQIGNDCCAGPVSFFLKGG